MRKRTSSATFRKPGAMKRRSLAGHEVNVLLREASSSILHAPLIHCYHRYKGTEIVLILLISARTWAPLKVVAHVFLEECFMKKKTGIDYLFILPLSLCRSSAPSRVTAILFTSYPSHVTSVSERIIYLVRSRMGLFFCTLN